MTNETSLKISIGIIVALLLGVGVGSALFFFGKNGGEVLVQTPVDQERGFPEGGERTPKPYQYPKAQPKSYSVAVTCSNSSGNSSVDGVILHTF